MRVPKYRVRPDRDSAFVEVGGRRVPLPGRAHSDASRTAYRQIVAEYLLSRAGDAETPAHPGWLVSVGELAAAWLDYCRTYYAATSHTRSNEYDNCRLAARPLTALFGPIPVRRLGPPEIKQLREVLADGSWSCDQAEKPIKPWSRQHINTTVAKIKRMLRWGVEAGLVPPEVSAVVSAVAPLRKGRSAAKESRPVKPISAEIVDATIPHMPPVVAAMVQVQRLTGMRSDNVCSLRPCEVDRSADVWIYRPPAHKSTHKAKNLAVAIGPRAQAVLAPYLDRSADSFCFSPREVGKYTVHRNRVRVRGERYVTNTYRNAVRRAVKRANAKRAEAAAQAGSPAPAPLPHWFPHQLRHLRTEEVKSAGGLEAARAYLGHSSVRTTELYDARDLDLASRIAREIG